MYVTKKEILKKKKVDKRVSWWKDTAETDRLLVIHYFLIKLDCGRKKKLFFCFFVFDFVLGRGKKKQKQEEKEEGLARPNGALAIFILQHCELRGFLIASPPRCRKSPTHDSPSQ